MLTLDAVYRTFQEQWLIGTDDKRESRESVLLAWLDEDHDDHDDDDILLINLWHCKKLQQLHCTYKVANIYNGGFRGVMVKVMDCGIIVSEFELE